MNNFYLKALAVVLIITVSFVFAHQAHAGFIFVIIGFLVTSLVTSVTAMAVVAGILATVTLGGVVASFICGSPLYPGGPCGDGGGAWTALSSQNLGCYYQVDMTFYNPAMNRGCRYVTTQVCTFEWGGTCYAWGTETTMEYGAYNDDASKNVAIYRFTLPASASEEELNDWFFNIKYHMGEGTVAIDAYRNFPFTPISSYDFPLIYIPASPFNQPCLRGTFDVNNNPHSSCWWRQAVDDTSVLAVVPYSQICSGDVCAYTDNTVPEDSYVVYGAKILGSFNAAYLHSSSLSWGDPDYLWSWYGCSTFSNKFLKAKLGSPWPGQYSELDSVNVVFLPTRNSPATTGTAFNGPYKTETCPETESLPNVNLISNGVVEAPNPIALSWVSANADSCVASEDWSGDKATGGSEQVSKSVGEYTFTITCTGPGGSASDTENVSVVEELPEPPPIIDLKANNSDGPINVGYDESAELSWSSSGADSCVASGGWSGDKAVSGTVSTGNLTEAAYFTLTCSGPGGSVSDTVLVNVGILPWWKEIIPW